MSFLKIDDPKKRDFIVNEHLKIKKNIQQSALNERLDDLGLQYDLTKLYKPITDASASTASELALIKEATQQTSNALQALPSQLKAITLPQYPSIQAAEESLRTLELGEIATQYLRKWGGKDKNADHTFGISDKDGNFYIGKSPITIQNNDVTVEGKTYSGTSGLWELLTRMNPDANIYTDTDLKNYEEILIDTKAMQQDKNPNKPKSSQSSKYKNIIKPLWDAIKSQTGSGLSKANTVILPSDPNELINMLELRMASFKAGNNGVRDEIVSISDTLKNMGVLDRSSYKSLMIQISK